MEGYLVAEAPPTVYYIPSFISDSEGKNLWDHVYATPRPKWTQLAHRRLQSWGGTPHPNGMMVESLPQWLVDCNSKISSLGIFEERVPNHVLINEYTAGQGIMPHEDGPLYYPTVTTVSLGSHTLLDFYRPISEAGSLESRYFLSLLLEPNSLVVLKDDMYNTYLHGITERTEDLVTDKICNINHLGNKALKLGDELRRTTRVSLTIRYVPKTVKLKLFKFK